MSSPCISGCSAGDVVFQLGSPADEVYIVERGQGEPIYRALVGVVEAELCGQLHCVTQVAPFSVTTSQTS